MPIPLNLTNQISDALNLLKQGEKAEAAGILNSIYNYLEKFWDTLSGFESMEMLGMLAHGFRNLSQTEKEISIMEKLCTLAEKDLDRLGLFASDNDIRSTGMDFIYLGLAYKKIGHKNNAREALNKAKKILDEINWEVDVENILKGKSSFIGPRKK